MYGIYPFEGSNNIKLGVAIVTGNMKTPPKEIQEQYSERLKKILSSLLSQVSFIIFLNLNLKFINCYNN
jgi:hypothetical protein